uniref:Glycosyltransferase family 92 protein n=1 Tax=Angiostrongylus cantonensis TaxID=6313 RepID=A0A0K0D3V8_ANGCA
MELQNFYEDLRKRGIGRIKLVNKNRNRMFVLLIKIPNDFFFQGEAKMNISLVSAFEHPDHIYVIKTSLNKYGDTVYCRYFDHQREVIGPPFETVVFPEFTTLCPRRKGAKYISLTDAPTILGFKISSSHYFSTCLAPLYGTEPKWLLLSEFFEHYKIQGVTYFYVYINKLDEYSRTLLDDYVRSGEAEVVILRDRFERDGKSWQLPGLQVGVIGFLESSSCSEDE